MRLWLLPAAVSFAALGQDAGTEHFEKKIRPVLAAKCYGCHSAKLKSPMGGLVLDTKAGLRKGGATGAAIVPSDPAASRMLTALKFSDPKLQMPPTGKLADAVVADFEAWIAMGAPDPRGDEAAVSAAPAPKGIDFDKGRQWWSFQPLRLVAAPAVKNAAWVRKPTDTFVLAALEKNGLAPSPEADARTLLRRVSLNLTGSTPSFSEAEAFAKDTSLEKYEKLVERMLDSPRYGERWGRYWLDVARFAEDNPTSEATNPPYPHAWRYRDWVIDAVQRDVPYDRFVKLQLAADLMPGTSRDDLRALGYLGTAPVYHKDARLSKDVIETLASDDWDERVDAVTRGILGLTVACARCHDHKFDPISTKDYYALAGVFASTSAVERPLGEIDAKTETRFLWIQQRLVHLTYLAALLEGEPGTKPEEAAQKAKRFRAEIATLRAELKTMAERYPQLGEFSPERRRLQRRGESTEASTSFMNAVYDAALWVDGSDADLTLMDVRPGAARDLPVFLRGNPASPGEMAPRRFPTVLAKAGGQFGQGTSGRLEMAERLFADAAPLAARVMVNRVWAWHFGKPLVPTTSDFGTQGEKPSHPELLENLAARFVANGWSMKWLHREIVLSSAYRQSSKPRAEGEKADPTNKWLWRMNPRRLDIEAFRDALLTVAGSLDEKLYGPSIDLDAETNLRRTVYSRVSRSRLNALLRLYDFPDASQHSPGRDSTTTPLQQLFVMNSAFLQEQSLGLVRAAGGDAMNNSDLVRALYRRVLARDPSSAEFDRALTFLAKSTGEQFAQALLATNEFIFWP